MVQVGKRLRGLTKHPQKKIKSMALDVFGVWKNIVIEEASKNDKKDGHPEGKISVGAEIKSPKAVPVMDDQIQTTEARKVEVISNPANGTVKKIVESENITRSDSSAFVSVMKTETVHVEKNGSKENNTETAPSKLTAMIKFNDPIRDKLREMIAEALQKVQKEVQEDMIEEVNAQDHIRVADTVESVMFEKLGRSNGAHKVKYRSIMFNLKDGNNPDLRRRVLLGEIKPERLIQMTPEEMASDQRKQENDQIKEKALFECERSGAPKATTDQFKCGRCGQRKTTYHQMQTRSADEPMTTFVTCVNCNNHWKFC